MTSDRRRRPLPMPGQDRPARRDSVGQGWIGFALGAALVTVALAAGLIFTFSVAVMPNLAGVDDHTFVKIAQRFNANPVFPLSFTVALLTTALALVLQAVFARGAAVRWTIAALVLYGVVLLITGGLHLPLNSAIDQAGDPERIGDIARVRSEFEAPWVVGNIVRTLFCTAAVAALARALLLHGRRHGRPERSNEHG